MGSGSIGKSRSLYSSPHALLASPEFLVALIVDEILAYLPAACSTMGVMAVLCGELGVSQRGWPGGFSRSCSRMVPLWRVSIRAEARLQNYD